MVVAVSQQVADVAQVPVDIAGHSFGGIDMTNAIKGNPELFNSAIFVCSAGIGRHSLRNFTFDVVRGFRVSQEALAGPYARQGIREGEHYLADDIPLALAEVIALSRTEIQHDIKTLKHAGGTVFIAAEHDSFFPPEKMRTELEKAGVRHDGFIEVPGAYHIFFAMNPEVASDVVLDALGKVKRRKKSTH